MKTRKIFMFINKRLYQKLYEYYGIYDENNNLIDSEISVENFFINLIVDSEKINYLLNTTSGIGRVTHLIIQKSFYSHMDLLFILSKIKILSPKTKVIIYMDEPFENNVNELFLHYLMLNELGEFVDNEGDLLLAVNNKIHHDPKKYILKKIPKKLMKSFRKS